ncbi:TIGR02281 family clan AA aspartic protease [Asticcacaulis tiandongensis]|uniref:TIGR02281 family clan AA aspartic protease n=1 Tax=Asticcacaulis tiandongensis TaxID=2565365 RepID=UPI00112D5F0B|nr:TIGR02281 family clan AA aspartic protease [Asticcacaulis tiandongensis]
MSKSAVVMASAIVCAVLSGLAVAQLERIVTAPSAPAVSYAQTHPVSGSIAVNSEAAVIGGITAIPKATDGHFWAEARVNQTVVRFLVDTGASVVALTPEDARRLGVDPSRLTYDRDVTTAMGKTKAAHVMIDSMGIGQSRMQNVEALVIRDGLSTSLLGMSYLGRLRRFEATPSSLILHP